MRRLVGTNFARLRAESGLTQEAVSERSGLTQHYLSGLERGQRNPTVITLFEVAQALGVDVVEFFRPIDQRAASKRKARGRPAKS